MRRLRELARKHGVTRILVGLPLRLDGTRGEMAEEAERFANRVRKQIGVPVELADERLTSWEAERRLEEEFGRTARGRSRAKGEEKISAEVSHQDGSAPGRAGGHLSRRERNERHRDAEKSSPL